LAGSSYGFIKLFNSSSSQVTLFAPTNDAFARILNNVALTGILGITKVANVTFLEFALANHILPTTSANSSVLSQLLLQSNQTRPLLIDFDYAETTISTLAGLNISLAGIVQNGTSVSATVAPPLLFVQNAFVVTPNAIVAENGVVHVVSNVIDPYILATGGLFGPTEGSVVDIDSAPLGPLFGLIRGFLNNGQ
jgi:uncharacterized surface protein with fasciclin (FAS1) repeats